MEDVITISNKLLPVEKTLLECNMIILLMICLMIFNYM
jgi:hypothetical protein